MNHRLQNLHSQVISKETNMEIKYHESLHYVSLEYKGATSASTHPLLPNSSTVHDVDPETHQMLPPQPKKRLISSKKNTKSFENKPFKQVSVMKNYPEVSKSGTHMGYTGWNAKK